MCRFGSKDVKKVSAFVGTRAPTQVCVYIFWMVLFFVCLFVCVLCMLFVPVVVCVVCFFWGGGVCVCRYGCVLLLTKNKMVILPPVGVHVSIHIGVMSGTKQS